MPDRPTAALWDPVSATVYRPVQSLLASNEATSSPEAVGLVSVRAVGLFNTTRLNQESGNTQSNQYLDVRIPSAGENLTSECFIIHRGMRYEIVGISGSDWQLQYTRYQVNVTNDFIFSG